MERITRLRTPPVVGKFYLVPTVNYPWTGVRKDWPVFLPRHEDADHLNFAAQHYHIDPRFMDKRMWAVATRRMPYSGRHKDGTLDQQAFAAVQSAPLSDRDLPDHPPIVWKQKRCARATIDYQWSAEISERLAPAYIGKQCRRAKAGWICPHKRVPLGTFPPVNGIIICPLHGLQIRAETGKVIGPVTQCEEAA